MTDFQLNLSAIGCIIAAIATVAAALQQTLVRYLQVEYALSSSDFMIATAPSQAVVLLLLGPILDKLSFNVWIIEYPWNIPVASLVALTCFLALLVNLSQAACLGSFSALTFQAS